MREKPSPIFTAEIGGHTRGLLDLVTIFEDQSFCKAPLNFDPPLVPAFPRGGNDLGKRIMQPRNNRGRAGAQVPPIPSLAPRSEGLNLRSGSPATQTRSNDRTVQVQNFFTIRDGGALKAFFDVQLPIGSDTLEICRCRLIQQGDQAPWVSGPVESWEDEGKKKYRHLVKIPERWKERILALALAEFEAPGGRVIGGRTQ